jgi:hypothetical protein
MKQLFRLIRILTIRLSSLGLYLLSLLYPFASIAQDEHGYDLITVYINVHQYGGAEFPAVIKDQEIYLPIPDLFSFLKILNTPSASYDSVTGFFINPGDVYVIDNAHDRIQYQKKVFELKPDDLIRTEDNLYMKSNYFGLIFGLVCTFDFRSLSIILTTKLELPVIREMRLEQLRRNIKRLKGEMKADTIIPRSYPVFHFGMADWSVIATQRQAGISDARLFLELGSIIAGGETNVSLNYSSSEPFVERQQYYYWHYANNDYKVVRQVTAGKITPLTISSLYSPVLGIQITNTPTTYRRSFCTYTLSQYTEPGWIVELYVNNVMVDYVKADPSGYFTFEVPLIYGNSKVTLRFYGPWGEERAQEQNISIPYNFLPPKKLEYTISTGIVEDLTSSRFSRANINYGVNKRLTIGGGIEYLSSTNPGNTMPFVNFSLRLASTLLISSEYVYGVRFRGVMNYRLPSDLMFQLEYSNYNKDQKAVINNFLQERKGIISMPVHGAHFSSLFRLTIDQVVLQNSSYITGELLASGSVFGVNTNLTTDGIFTDPVHPYIYSSLGLGFKLPWEIILTPQLQYEYSHSRFMDIKMQVEKHLFRNGIFNAQIEQNFLSNVQNFQIGFRYEFPFAQSEINASNSNHASSLVISGRGSLFLDAKTNTVGANNRTSVGRGGLVILPFLDLDGNGRRDPGEPKAYGLNFHIAGGRMERNKRDSTIRVYDLEPFTNTFIEVDALSFENIAWQVIKPVISVAIDPNQFKLVEVPISVMGEVSGVVNLADNTGESGLARILVNFYGSDSTIKARLLTESDGFFTFLGFLPGKYTARIDPVQLHKLHLVSTPDTLQFTIARTMDGDQVTGLKFVLKPAMTDTSAMHAPAVKQNVSPEPEKKVIGIEEKPVVKNTIPPAPHKEEETPVTQKDVNTGGIKVQVGAFHVKSNALAVQSQLIQVAGKPVIIIFEDGYYKVRISGFKGIKEVKNFLVNIRKEGFPDAFIIRK